MSVTIHVPAVELFDQKTNTFRYTKATDLHLEHSLVSISKWESKWHVPFLTKKEKTPEQMRDYIKCMTITQNVSDDVYLSLNENHIKAIADYIDNPMTATTISKTSQPPNREIITSELIYYWMFSYGIPMECQKWHLNRLITLINVFSVKNSPPKKMSKNELMARNRALNEQRRAKLNSKG